MLKLLYWRESYDLDSVLPYSTFRTYCSIFRNTVNMRLMCAFTGVIVAHLLMTLLTVVAAQGGRNGRRRQASLGHITGFTPLSPAPDEVNCHITIRQIEYAGGRCIQLGTRSVCQSAVALDPFSSQCSNTNRQIRNRGARRRGRNNSGRRRTRGHRRVSGQYAALFERLSNGDTDDLSRFTPSPPALEDVECHVAVRRTEQVGGRCIQLGANSIHACQAGAHLDPFSQDCERQNGGRGRPRGHSLRRSSRGRSPQRSRRSPHV
ncbi:uncharacterized protein [Haliotis asinina]|uniref:uncharacterized protein n=1 Tax=Haliotis asinina TaxID=109174 RepID=UPI0035325C59